MAPNKHPLHQPFRLLSHEQQQQAFVEGMPHLNELVSVVAYQPNWVQLFEKEAQAIRRLLGSAVLAVEHVGSTAVEGLAAKPIIDIDLSVANSADETAYLPVLEAAGYQLIIREPDWQEHRMLKGPATDINLHVWSLGSIEAQRHLIFRDWLRRNEADRQRYSQLKQKLATQAFSYLYQYNEAKAALIYEIYERAFADLAS